MPFVVSVRHDFQRFRATLSDIERRQLPFAMARALTDCAKLARRNMQDEMRKVFDRPTPFTLNSLRIEPASKTDLQANIHFRDYAPKGTAAGIYLRPQFDGGTRLLKRSEKRLQANNVMAPGSFLVPRSGARLDAYGNINRGQLVAVLSKLHALGDQSASTTRKARGKLKAERYFAVKARGTNRNAKLSPGIYQRISRTELKPIFGFASHAQYQQRLDFFGFAEDAYTQEMPRLMREALANAMASRR